jgi:hypothetical protein
MTRECVQACVTCVMTEQCRGWDGIRPYLGVALDDHALHHDALLQTGPHDQGLTVIHFSAQLEPCLSRENTLHTLITPKHHLDRGFTTPTRTPYPIQSAQVELTSERV